MKGDLIQCSYSNCQTNFVKKKGNHHACCASHRSLSNREKRGLKFNGFLSRTDKTVPKPQEQIIQRQKARAEPRAEAPAVAPIQKRQPRRMQLLDQGIDNLVQQHYREILVPKKNRYRATKVIAGLTTLNGLANCKGNVSCHVKNTVPHTLAAIGLGLVIDTVAHWLNPNEIVRQPIQNTGQKIDPIILKQKANTDLSKQVEQGMTISAKDYRNIEIDKISFNPKYSFFMGDPQRNFYMTVHGSPGHGKSTFCVEFAQYFQNKHGKVLYLASEQSGLDQALQQTLNDYNATFDLETNPHRFSKEQMIEKFRSYDLVILDSVNDLGLYPYDVKDYRKESNAAVIAVLQSTKDGKFKGAQTWLHDVGISVKAENFEAVLEKTRYRDYNNNFPDKNMKIKIGADRKNV